MATVTIGVASEAETRARAQGAYLSFPSVALLWKTLSPKRWDLLRAMAGAGPLAIREAARRVGRDVKSVHGDVQTLIAAGMIARTDDGRVVFPYDAVRVDFTLNAA